MLKTAVDPALRSAAIELQEALTDLVRVNQFRDRDTICCYDVSLVQSQAIERLAGQGPMTLNEFAASLFLEKSSASRLADGLERKGYVTRRPHPEDARYVQIELTKPGRALAQKLLDDLVDERAHVLGELSPAERATVIESIRKLASAAASRVDTSGGSCTRR